jgi:hypothetical protein
VVETAAAQMQDRLQEIMGIRAKMIPSTSPVVEVSIVVGRRTYTLNRRQRQVL